MAQSSKDEPILGDGKLPVERRHIRLWSALAVAGGAYFIKFLVYLSGQPKPSQRQHILHITSAQFANPLIDHEHMASFP